MPDSPEHSTRRHGVAHLGHPDAHIPGYEIPASASARISRRTIAIGTLIAGVIALFGARCEHVGHGVANAVVPAGWIAPFVLLVAAIALAPFISRHWWEKNYAFVSLGLGTVVTIYYLGFVINGRGNLARTLAEYISFIFLLASLFIVSGGILIRVRARATPIANVMLLLIGAIIANIFGTTGAAMLLIRPFLRMNRDHLRPYHVVFFIFIVANVGGSLTPIGDPPLFLGYLLGVPFFWVFQHCWPIWIMVVGLLLAIFFAIDFRAARSQLRKTTSDDESGPLISVYGLANLLFIAMILAGILLGLGPPWREILMAIAAAGSLLFTPHRIHSENRFNYVPIREVALLFIGIFITMLPATNYLSRASSAGEVPVHTPGQYFFTSGAFSGVLDNAPTYLAFINVQISAVDADSDKERIQLIIADEKLNHILVAISMGAVLFGAATYIGNGPNFMVKGVAENSGAPTPSFFGYIVFFTLPILLPVLILVWLIFLR